MFDNTFGEAIHTYSRAQALADGSLRDITEFAREYGFKYPVHVALYAWADAIAWEHDDASQDETGRAWDVLTMARLAIRAAIRRGHSVGPVPFTVVRITAPDKHKPQPITLEIELGPGDKAEPVFTITAPADR